MLIALASKTSRTIDLIGTCVPAALNIRRWVRANCAIEATDATIATAIQAGSARPRARSVRAR